VSVAVECANGNHRVSFIVLSAALWSLGLSSVEFEEDDELIAPR